MRPLPPEAARGAAGVGRNSLPAASFMRATPSTAAGGHHDLDHQDVAEATTTGSEPNPSAHGALGMANHHRRRSSAASTWAAQAHLAEGLPTPPGDGDGLEAPSPPSDPEHELAQSRRALLPPSEPAAGANASLGAKCCPPGLLARRARARVAAQDRRLLWLVALLGLAGAVWGFSGLLAASARAPRLPAAQAPVRMARPAGPNAGTATLAKCAAAAAAKAGAGPGVRPAAETARPLRIVLATGAFHAIRDGVALSMNRLAEYLEVRQHEVVVMAPGDVPATLAGRQRLPVPQPLERRLVPPASVAMPGRPEYKLALGLGQAGEEALRALRPDLVHLATPDPLGMALQSWAWHHGIPVVCSFHTRFTAYFPYYHVGLLEEPAWFFWLANFYKGCDHVYVPSDSIYRELLDHGLREDRLRYWMRGVDTAQFHPAHRCPTWRRELGIGDDEVLVLMTTRLVWEKGLTLVADVFNALRAAGVRFRSVVVGDGPAREEFQAMTPETIFVGTLMGEALSSAYASADVFFFPSQTETFGNVVLEAMASRLPVVASDASGSRMMVEPGVNGYMVEYGDVPGYVAALRQLVEDAGVREELAAEARRQAEEKWNWETILDQLAGHYVEATRDSYAETHARTHLPNPLFEDPAENGEFLLANPFWGEQFR